MQLSRLEHHTAPVAYDRLATQRQFNELALDLTRSDAEITSAYENGNTVGSGWDDWFMGAAEQLSDARDAYVALVPQDRDLAARLQADALDLASSSGSLDMMERHGNRFGSGWDTTLDRKIADVRAAAERLSTDVPPAPPAPPAPPVPGGPSSVAVDAARAAELVRQSIEKISTVPTTDKGDASTKDARIGAFNLNMEAQKVLEQYFGSDQAPGRDAGSPEVLSQMRAADAHLEDANWQLAKKPSPDGRFNGVDIPGALRDSQSAVAILEQLSIQPAAA